MQRLKTEIKDRAKKHLGTASQLIGTYVLDVEQELRPLIETKNLKELINQTKRGNRPKEPDYVDSLDLDSEEWQPFLQFDGENWCVFDNKQKGERVLMFTTEKNVTRLFSSRQWHLDGTFKKCRKVFSQLYKIHGCEWKKFSVGLCFTADEKRKHLPNHY